MTMFPGILPSILPPDRDDLLTDAVTSAECGPAFMYQFNQAVSLLYSRHWQACQRLCKVLLDIIWEHLNTGHWKDVPVVWRFISFVP